MENILLIGVALSSLLSGGVVGTMIAGQNGNINPYQYHMMQPDEWIHMDDYEDLQQHLEKHCRYGSFEDCEWMDGYHDGEYNEDYKTTSADKMTKSLFQRILDRFPRAFPIIRWLLDL